MVHEDVVDSVAAVEVASEAVAGEVMVEIEGAMEVIVAHMEAAAVDPIVVTCRSAKETGSVTRAVTRTLRGVTSAIAAKSPRLEEEVAAEDQVDMVAAAGEDTTEEGDEAVEVVVEDMAEIGILDQCVEGKWF